LESVGAATSQSNGYSYRFDAAQPLKLSAKAGFKPRFAVVPLQRTGERRVPLEPLAKGENKALDLEGVLDEDRPDRVTLKLSHKLLAQLKESGLPGGELPREADLVPLPKQVYKRMLAHLVRLAQGWVFERKPLPAALLHLLERRRLPALVELNEAIRHEPASTAEALADFLQQADGIGLSLQGPPGTGKTTVTGQLIAELVASGQRVAVSSNTNEAINNLLRKAQDCLDAKGSSALAVKVSSSSSESADRKAWLAPGFRPCRTGICHRIPRCSAARSIPS